LRLKTEFQSDANLGHRLGLILAAELLTLLKQALKLSKAIVLTGTPPLGVCACGILPAEEVSRIGRIRADKRTSGLLTRTLNSRQSDILRSGGNIRTNTSGTSAATGRSSRHGLRSRRAAQSV
jgi:hypothetical protein